MEIKVIVIRALSAVGNEEANTSETNHIEVVYCCGKGTPRTSHIQRSLHSNIQIKRRVATNYCFIS